MAVSTFYDNVPHPQDENRMIQQAKYRSSATGDKVYNTKAEAQAAEGGGGDSKPWMPTVVPGPEGPDWQAA